MLPMGILNITIDQLITHMWVYLGNRFTVLWTHGSPFSGVSQSHQIIGRGRTVLQNIKPSEITNLDWISELIGVAEAPGLLYVICSRYVIYLMK